MVTSADDIGVEEVLHLQASGQDKATLARSLSSLSDATLETSAIESRAGEKDGTQVSAIRIGDATMRK